MSVAGRKRMFYFPYNEKAFASEFQSFLRQVVGSYSEKLSDRKRGLLQKCSILTEKNATLTTGKLLRAVCRCAPDFESAVDAYGMRRKISSKMFFDRVLKELKMEDS